MNNFYSNNKMFFLLSVLIIILSISCKSPNQQNANTLLEVDKHFSKLSLEKGMNYAFLEYAHDSAVILKDNSMPIIGKSSISKIYNKPDSLFSLTWEPLYANISISGDLGYTYGIYTFRQDSSIEKGTYVSIWKKTKSGWKYILDSGNKGLTQEN